MIKIAESCKKLTVFSLYSCSQISDATLDKLGEYCPLLEKFDCRGCPLITHAAVFRHKQRLPDLKINYDDFEDEEEEDDDFEDDDEGDDEGDDEYDNDDE